jgi:hypothetical protein
VVIAKSLRAANRKAVVKCFEAPHHGGATLARSISQASTTSKFSTSRRKNMG